MKKVVYLPLDERPCNLAFVQNLSCDNKSLMLVAPALSEMGRKKTPAKYEDIRAFLERECANADYLIIAIDTLLYGGIIPSRLHQLDKDELIGRLHLLEEIKAKNKSLHVCAFSLVMRCPCYSSDAEEPDYYAECGREIFLYGQNEHKFKLGIISREEYEKERERLGACEKYIEDYTSRRAKNLACLIEVIRMMGSVIDDFTILQDDSNPYGYTTMDRERLIEVARDLEANLFIYPGADEGGIVMLSRVATYIERRSPRIYPVFPHKEAADVVPIYEDREIRKTLSAQIKSAGAVECGCEEDADIILFCNLNDKRTYDVYMNYTKQEDEGYHAEFAERIRTAIDKGVGVAIADIAYCNAGDIAFLSELNKRTDLLGLWGYAGWNTASNTIGTVICQAVLRYLYGDTDTHRRFTAMRILDDTIYSAEVRREMMALESLDCDLIVRKINDLARAEFPSIAEKYEAGGCYLPWSRLFEIALSVKVKK